MKRFVLALIAFGAMNVYAQGLHWQQKTTGTPMGDHTTDHWAAAKKFKTVQSGGDGGIIIMRLDKELMWNIDPKKKTYEEMTFAELEQVASKAGGNMDAAMTKMKEQMKDMPEEQRKMMEKMMGGKMPNADSNDEGKLNVKKTGDKKTVSGYACTKYILTHGNDEFMTLWVTKDVKGFDALASDWKEFSKRMASLSQRFAKGSSDAFLKIDGFPMETSMKMMGNEIVTTTTKVERTAIAPSEFDLPSGYTKQPSKVKKMMEEMEEEN
jgi:hypothetical protein